MRYLACLLQISVLLVCGCGPAITGGIIVSKDFSPTHSETSNEPVYHYDYNYFSGEFEGHFVWEDVTRHYPDKWTITIRGEDDDGETQTATLELDSDRWYPLNVGDLYGAEQQ